MFFMFAMTTDAVGSVIPRIIAEFELSMTAGGAFHYATMGGIAAGALLLGAMADRFGRKPMIMLGLALYGLSCLIIAFSNEFAAFVALLALGGLGISVFKTAALASIGDICAASSAHTRLMNTVEGTFALGAIAGPALVAWLLSAGASWKWLYVIAAALCGALVIATTRVRYPPARSTEQRPTAREIRSVLSDPMALFFSTLVALYVAVEVAIYVWMPTLLQSYAGAHAFLPVYALTIFFVLRALGRFLGAWLLGWLPWGGALAACAGGIFACFLGTLVWGVEAGAWLLPISGLFMSILYPTLNSKGISCFPRERQGAAAGVILFFTAAAATLAPLIMALVSDAYGTPRAGFVLAAALAGLLLAGLMINLVFQPARSRLLQRDGAP
jgi:fucose permease